MQSREERRIAAKLLLASSRTHITTIILVLLIVFSCVKETFSGLTCQGDTFDAAIADCPDYGSQRLTAGGNVSIVALKAINLDKITKYHDLPSPSTGFGASDPYVRFTYGRGYTSQSSVIRNTENPVWNEKVSLGLIGSGTEILVEVFDYDIGLEGSDDLIASKLIRTPFCSTFKYDEDERIFCETPFGCSSDESSWASPVRQVCKETTWINLIPGKSWTEDADCRELGEPGDENYRTASGICIQIEVNIIPFQMKFDLPLTENFIQGRPPVLTALGLREELASWTKKSDFSTGNSEGNNFGFLYQSLVEEGDLIGSTDSKQIEGALMLQHNKEDKFKGRPGSISYWLSVNFPAAIYVCRDTEDNEVAIPTWLQSSHWIKKNSTGVRIKIYNQEASLECFYQMSDGTTRNKYDGVVRGAVPIGPNTVGEKYSLIDTDVQYQLDYRYMYTVVAKPVAPITRSIDTTILYDASGFISGFFSYGMIALWFLFLSFRMLSEVNYRVDRVLSYLLTKSFTGENKHVVGALFGSNGETPCNIEYRSRMYHGTNILYFFLLVPFILIISWGANQSFLYQPSSLGTGITWLGMAAVLFYYGYKLWKTQLWRMDNTIILSFSMGVLFCLVFMISIIFSDPLVSKYDQPINFPSISLLFGTINCVPLLFLVFKQDKMYKNDLKKVIQKMSDTVYDIAEGEGKVSKKKKTLNANKSFHALLGSSYTINPNVPMLNLASVMQDSVKKEKEGDNSETVLYRISLLFLFIYFIIAAVSTAYPSIAFVNCLALMLLDSLHKALSKGDTHWSPAYKIFLLVMGRLLIMSCDGRTWLMNYCLAYIVYSIAFVDEMINIILPQMTKAQAGEIAFTGKDDSFVHSQDMAGTPYFTFFTLTFCFIAIVLVAIFGEYDTLPLEDIEVFGASWNASVFGIISVLAVITGGLAMATARAFYLKGNGLLKGYARTGYFLKTEFDVPMILAVLTEVAIVSSAIIIYAATDAAAVLILGIFIPPIVGCLAYSYSIWIANDYELVHWPPADEEDLQEGETPSDLDVAFNMIEGLFGQEDVPETNEDEIAEQGESRTLKGFELPKLEVTGEKSDGPIKMPALPLKSVLRKKREKLGIKVKTAPIIKDVRARDGAETDKFGAGDIIDVNDPWSQFEQEDDMSDDEKPLVEKKVLKYKVVRRGFLEHPALLKLIDQVRKNPMGRMFINCWAKCLKSINDRRKAYQKVDPELEESSDEEGEEGEEDEEKKKEDSQLQSIAKTPFWSAVANGFLTQAEYMALGSWFMGLFLIFLMGVTMADYVSPSWLGHVIWVALILFLTTAVPIYQYFHTYVIDETTHIFIGFNILLHFMFCLLFFVVQLDADPGLPASLWIMDFFFYYPALIYIVLELSFWIDGNFVIEKIDKDGDGTVTPMEYLMYFRAYPMLIFMAIILDWQFFFWIGELIGVLGVLLLLTVCASYFFVRDWATNDFYVSPEMKKIGDIMIKFVLFILFCVCLFSAENPMLPLCILFFILMCRLSTSVITKLLLTEPESIMYVSPFILPVYTYNPKTNDVEDESDIIISCLFLGMTGFVWGFFFAIFYYPVNIGVTITCFFLLFFSAALAASVAHIPMTLGQLCNLTTAENVQDSGKLAVQKFLERRTPLNLEMDDWYGEADESKQIKYVTHAESLKLKTIIEICVDIINEVRALSFIKDDEVKQEEIIEVGDVDEVIPTAWEKFTKLVSEQLKKAFDAIPMGKLKGYRRHSESLFDITDAIAEAIVVGKGPLGFIGCDGLLFKLFKEAQSNPRLQFLQQPWLNAYDEAGNKKSNALLFEKMDHAQTISNLVDCDNAVNHCFREETRCAVHFLCMVIVGANAKLARETVLFQKFLRENRFRLASNDITPPPEIFSSASFTSIDIPLVAVWLSTLTIEERERFNLLKTTFSTEQQEKDYAVDNEDYAMTLDALNILEERSVRDQDMVAKTKRNAEVEQHRRVQNFAGTLNGAEKAKFDAKMKVWTENSDVYVDSKDQELYDKFQEACHGDSDAVTDYARYTLGQLELAMQDCRLGEYGRNYQYVDPEFTPGDFALGNSPASQNVLGWRCAPGISENSELFEGGADPDDVESGVYDNIWLLSAICMLAAGGGFGSDIVVDALQNVFIGKVTPEGTLNFSTEVGAYCIRLYKDGIWNPLILDDLFPMLQHNLWTNENKGIAVAHSKECNELWVSLIEKGFAKFYGSYTALERGFVHHALKDLTGCETECVCLSHASRGVGKRTLWQKLLKFKSNDYILGAGTGTAALADKEILEMGIVFESAYTIYDVQYIDGLQLLKLRNPPGDHEEWKGDWSDKSSLWNRRLKSKLGWADVDDNTFWMNFDDFCNVFRYLYVCKYYSKKWHSLTIPGIWKKSNELEQENKDDIKNIIMQSDPSLGGTIDASEEKKKKMKARVDTSGGLPHKHNPACILENNPHYSMQIHRPTDFRIMISQTDSRGNASAEIHPFAIYVVKNEHPSTPMRLKELNRDNVILHSGEPRRERVQYLYGSLNPGLYVVLIAAYVSGLEGNFTCSLLSNYRTSFSSFYPPAWMVRRSKSKAEREKEKSQINMDEKMDKAAKKTRKFIRDLFGSAADDDAEESSSDED